MWQRLFLPVEQSKRPTQISLRENIVFCNSYCVRPEVVVAAPISDLPPTKKRKKAKDDCRGCGTEAKIYLVAIRKLRETPNGHDEDSDQGQIAITVGHCLVTDLNQANDRH
jgi:hypothetical protein